MKKAILFGASGFIGSHLLNELLDNPGYEQVTIVVRNPLDIHHPKLRMLTGDYRSLSGLSSDIDADDVFITLGTTKKKTPNKIDYYQVDHDYPVLAAKIAKENGAKSVFVVTAIGANARSGIFYVRTKGETERDIIALDYEHTHIFRPSMIMGNRKEKRSMEKLMMKIWVVITPLLVGGLNKYKDMKGEDIAKAINRAAGCQSGKVKIYHWKDMHDLITGKYQTKNTQ